MKLAIIGGGIGGLSAALHLLRAGLDVQVYEQAPRISEIGAGIQIGPNASRLLHRLGLRAAMDRIGVFPQAVNQRRWDDGRTLQRAPVGKLVEETFGAPYYHFHRADLANLLADALPADRVHTRHKLVGVEDTGGKVVARFENGMQAEADVLVGADGIHSRVSARRRRASPAASPGAGWCRPRKYATSASKWPRTTGWGRTATSFTTGCRAAGS